MATLTTVRLTKGDSPSWGFRLQGGKDFGTPLVIQKVNGGSPAERAGLIAGDSVIKINNVDVYNLLHKEAQDVIVRAGNGFDMVIQRGGSTWKPSVIPTGTYAKPSPSLNNVSPVTKTSLAAAKGENIGAIGTGHNLAAKPFAPQVNGAVNGGGKLVNKQYNTPLKLYSEDAIAETISAQSEVLSTGALGVNFKKNEKNYDATNSAVYRMLQEAENDPAGNEPEPDSGIVTAPNRGIAGLRHVDAPQTKPAPSNPQLPPGQNICAECERLIVGVFVRIKDKNLHVECFKCATCGSSLKNVGYYNINNKLYCDIHAKAAAIAINNPAAIPITVPASGKAPGSAISAALSSHSLPSPSPLSPKTPSYAPSYPSGNTGGPRPFSSVSAPLSPGGSLPRAAPLSPQSNFNKAPLSPAAPSYSSYSPTSTAGRTTNIIWPPPQEESDIPTACPLFYPPPSKVEAELEKKFAAKKTEATADSDGSEDLNLDETMSFYSEEFSFSGRRSATECVEILSETLDTQKLVENVIKSSPSVITPPLTETRGGIGCCQPKDACDLGRPNQYNSNGVDCHLPSKIENAVPQKWEPALTQAIRTTAPDSDTFSRIPSRRTASPMTSALTVAPTQPFNPIPHSILDPVPLPEFTEPYLPPEHPVLAAKQEIEEKKVEKPPIPKPYSPFVKALEIAPDRPFAPVSGPAPVPPVKKKPKDPLDKLLDELPKPNEHLDMRSALTTAPERCYTPLATEQTEITTTGQTKKDCSKEIDRSQLTKPLKPEELPASFQMNKKEPKPPSYYAPVVIEERMQAESRESVEAKQNKEVKIIEKETIQPGQTTQQIFSVPEIQQPITGNFAPIFQGFSCSFKNKSDHSQFSVEVNTTPPVPTPPPKPQTPISYIATVSEPASILREKIVQESTDVQQTRSRQENVSRETKVERREIEKQAEELVQVKPVPVTAMLHKAETLPSYQKGLQATAEADLLLMERRQKAEARLQQQKLEREQHVQQQQQRIQQQHMQQQVEQERIQQQHIQQECIQQQHTQQQRQYTQQQHAQQQHTQQQQQPQQKPSTIKPIITIEPGDGNNVAQKMNFQPVLDEKPGSTTFSPRPRSITPSMISKAPPLLPYYQDNLVPHFHPSLETNVFDPTRPDISRSPSPCPGKEPQRSRSPSPFPSRQDRAKSPAEGPPPNPLHSHKPLPTPQDSRVQLAKENLKSYLPEYKSQRDIVEQHRGMDFYKKEEQSGDYSQNVAYPMAVQTGNVQHHVQQMRQVADSQKNESKVAQIQGGMSKTDISEKMHQEHLAALSKKRSENVEVSADGLTQVQRKKVVTEEYEKSHKETNIQIETNVTSTTMYPISKVNTPGIESPVVQSIHITNPHHIPPPPKGTQALSQQCQFQCQPETCRKQSFPQVQAQQPQPSEPATIPPQPPVRKVFPPGSLAPIKHVTPPSACQKPSENVTKPNVPKPDVGAGSGRQSGGITAAPKRGKGLLNTSALPGARIPLCGQCHGQIRGPFITALGKIWCPQHFVCATPSCRRPLQDLGFVEERGQLYCEYCFEQYLAPPCSKCNGKIKADCLKAIGKNFHPECFNCVYCGKLFGNNPFFLEDGNPYCDADWNELFTTKCFACGFPVEAGDRWVEALNNNYHSQCFNCTMCKKNLEGQSFFAKGGRPFCKNHAR